MGGPYHKPPPPTLEDSDSVPVNGLFNKETDIATFKLNKYGLNIMKISTIFKLRNVHSSQTWSSTPVLPRKVYSAKLTAEKITSDYVMLTY